MDLFKLESKFAPAGDQPKVIDGLCEGLAAGKKDQVLLGVTGSGKTFTMANIIQETGRPALIMAHNKTLAAQLYHEMREFFPQNAVEYFVSYYDYYQPEAYIPRTDTYIEKDSSINDQIDLLRHSATRSLLERPDVIVVASVSCIYGLGSPELYGQMTITLETKMRLNRDVLINKLITLQYHRNEFELSRGNFRVRGEVVDIFPSHTDERAWRIQFFGNEIEEIWEFDPLTGHRKAKLKSVVIYASSHYVTPQEQLDKAIIQIEEEMVERVAEFEAAGKVVEAQRLKQRCHYDIEMLQQTGNCKGIENYSRYLSGRSAGQPPPTLLEYLPHNAILFIDESHVTMPQINAMYNGDRARKTTLVEYGFRLPSALDNRPLKFAEWDMMRSQTIYVSATPGKYELEMTGGKYFEQIIRPTGLLDPICHVRPLETQVDDLLHECRLAKEKNERVMVTTLTKKMAEDLSSYMEENGINVTYLHSEILTLERVEIINSLRKGEIDVLVGVNLLREGLDIPECALVAILDADKEGFLRSETSLIQTIGRAARNANGRVILYADKMTNSITKALAETERRREVQDKYNKAHGIVPKTISKAIATIWDHLTQIEENHKFLPMKPEEIEKEITFKRKEMIRAASDLDFENAAKLRDEVKQLEELLLKAQ